MFDVVQKESKKMKKTKRVSFPFHISFQLKRILTWVLIVILIILLIGYYLYNNYYSNYNYIKEDTSEYLVYTLSSSVNDLDMRNEIPYINIDSEDAHLVNKTIQEYANSFLKNKNNLFIYDSQVNGEVLSVLLKMLDYDEGYSYPEVSFHTYNFNLRTQSLMSDKEVLDLFDVGEKDVLNNIEGTFRSYYNDEVSKGYLVPEECDYDCFLDWRGISDYMDSVHYYIKNGKLIAYRPFSIYSVYGEEEYYNNDSYQFYISD